MELTLKMNAELNSEQTASLISFLLYFLNHSFAPLILSLVLIYCCQLHSSTFYARFFEAGSYLRCVPRKMNDGKLALTHSHCFLFLTMKIFVLCCFLAFLIFNLVTILIITSCAILMKFLNVKYSFFF